jgi:hypothetical protein
MSKNNAFLREYNGAFYNTVDQNTIDKENKKSLLLTEQRNQKDKETLKRIFDAKQKQESNDVLKIPVVNMETDRRTSIILNSPATFEIIENPSADSSEPFIEIDFFDEVDGKEELYDSAGEEMDIDADFLKAIAYMETTHGYYDHLGVLPGVEISSFRPMNVRYESWEKLAQSLNYSKDDIEHNTEANIRLGALILKRIWVRVQNPTIRKVASIYNFTGAEKVRDYGARVNFIYVHKLWKNEK